MFLLLEALLDGWQTTTAHKRIADFQRGLIRWKTSQCGSVVRVLGTGEMVDNSDRSADKRRLVVNN
jgi:hypothetical protein